MFEHWQIWLSGGGLGGFLVIAVALVEKLSGRSLSKRAHVYLFLIAFFLCACFLSWVDKDDALVSERQARVTDKGTYQTKYGSLSDDYNALKSQCQYQAGVRDTLDKQNRDQQNTINNCQSEALKLLAPKPQKLTGLVWSNSVTEGVERKDIFLLITNKLVAPVRIDGGCDVPLKSVSAAPVGISTYSGGATLPNPMLIVINFSTPGWSPQSPIRLDVEYTNVRRANCSFIVR